MLNDNIILNCVIIRGVIKVLHCRIMMMLF